MKTAISVPDETFDRVERRTQELGMSRSEFFTRAAQRYLDDLDAASITRRIDEVLSDLPDGGDESWVDAAESGRRVLGRTDGW